MFFNHPESTLTNQLFLPITLQPECVGANSFSSSHQQGKNIKQTRHENTWQSTILVPIYWAPNIAMHWLLQDNIESKYPINLRVWFHCPFQLPLCVGYVCNNSEIKAEKEDQHHEIILTNKTDKAEIWQKILFSFLLLSSLCQRQIGGLSAQCSYHILMFGQTHIIFWTNIFCNLYQHILYLGQMHFGYCSPSFYCPTVPETNGGIAGYKCSSSYILPYGQIYSTIQTNVFCYLDKFTLWFGLVGIVLLPSIVHLCHRQMVG